MSKMKNEENGMAFYDLFDYTKGGIEKYRNSDPNELKLLLKEIIDDKRLRPMEWEVLSDRFFNYVHGKDRKQAAQSKTNLARALSKDDLTWGRFVEAIMVLGYDDYEFVVRMKNKNQETPHEFTIKKRNPLRRVRKK